MKNLKITTMIISALFLSAGLQTSAQITAASNADNVLNTSFGSNFSDVHTLNTDMVTVGTGDKMTAIAITALSSSGYYNGIHVECNGFTDDRQFTYSNAMTPDIVLADNIDNTATLGEDYLVAVVYIRQNSSGFNEVWLEVFEYTDMGTGSAAYSTNNTYLLYTESAPGDYIANPHIDTWADRTNTSVNNMQQLHDYIITWDHAPDIDYVYGTLLPGGSTSVSSISAAVGVAPGDYADMNDVAAQTVLNPVTNGPDRTAWISYRFITPWSMTCPACGLYVLQLDFDNTGAPMGTTTTQLDNSHAFWPILPRIEAQVLADITSGVATWQVVAAEESPQPFTTSIYAFNDQTIFPASLQFDVSSAGSGANGPDYFLRSPCVAGVGPNMVPSASGIGTSQFSIGYYSTFTYAAAAPGSTGGDYYSNSIDMSGGGWSSTYNQYYEVNTNDIDGAGILLPREKTTMAITNSSNTGDDLYTVWWTGHNGSGIGSIMYKFAGNSYAFKGKRTNVDALAGNKEYKVYPNPTAGYLQVKGVQKAEYTILNVLGSVVKEGSIDEHKNTIDTKDLLPGVYLLNITENNYVQRVKFTKE